MNNNNHQPDDDDIQDASELRVSQLRKHAPTGGKRPYGAAAMIDDEAMDVEDEEEVDLDQPNLPEYFAQWDIPVEDVISMCRSYASYLTTQLRAGKPDLKNKRYK